MNFRLTAFSASASLRNSELRSQERGCEDFQVNYNADLSIVITALIIALACQ